MSATIVQLPEQSRATLPKLHYLNAEYGLKSWLLTGDHKRIAILYLISITFFFFLGGAFAGMIRLELLTPMPDLVASDTYNKLFSMHGIIMIFFFSSPPSLRRLARAGYCPAKRPESRPTNLEKRKLCLPHHHRTYRLPL
jgi:hypothetical protein